LGGGDAVPAGGPVADKHRVLDGQPAAVEDAAAEGVHGGAEARPADDFVVGHDGVGEGQGAVVADAAAPQGPVPAGDGQAVDGHHRASGDVEDPAEIAATDGQLARARAVDLQVVGDAQLPAREGDRAPGRVGEPDRVGARVDVGEQHGLPQRVRPAVGEGADGERAGDGAV